jgi:hypothetical protein
MNPLELYKRLPRKNCGKCRSRTCMPFALAVISGDAELSDCPLLTDIGAMLEEGSLKISCLGREFTVARDGSVSTRGRATSWIKILLLHYIRTSGHEDLSGRWASFSELRGGMVKASSFLRDCEDPLRELFDQDPAAVEGALLALGAERRSDFPTRDAWHLFLLPRIPVVILYWPAEEEFPSKVKVLFDSTADRFLDAESLIFLGEGLVRNIEFHR